MPLSFDIKQTAACHYIVTINTPSGQKVKYNTKTLWNCFKRIYEYVKDHLEETFE